MLEQLVVAVVNDSDGEAICRFARVVCGAENEREACEVNATFGVTRK